MSSQQFTRPRPTSNGVKETRSIMGMPITVDVADTSATTGTLAQVFAYFTSVDERFSTYKKTSEISRINRGELKESAYSGDMKEVFALSEKTKKETAGYFDIRNPQGVLDPSGLVKGWAIFNAAQLLKSHGFKDFYIDAGGDVQAEGRNENGTPWRIGIRDPFNTEDVGIVKIVYLTDCGIATSGNYFRGQHIYNPHEGAEPINDIVSLSVIGPNVYEADRFATAAFAMGRDGISFIERLPGFEGYAIDREGIATMTSGFERYTTYAHD